MCRQAWRVCSRLPGAALGQPGAPRPKGQIVVCTAILARYSSGIRRPRVPSAKLDEVRNRQVEAKVSLCKGCAIVSRGYTGVRVRGYWPLALGAPKPRARLGG